MYVETPSKDIMYQAIRLPGSSIRNSNTTNVCIANCKFCNFYRLPGHEEAYITTIEEYRQKNHRDIFSLVENSCCCKAATTRIWSLQYYADLFKQLKSNSQPETALGPPVPT
ncbi:MAG: hypothetical protein R2778_05970 [Saprospiraceae bacterium]